MPSMSRACLPPRLCGFGLVLGLAGLLALAGCQGPQKSLVKHADAKFAAHEYNAAYAAYKQAVDRDPKDFHSLLRLAECCLWLRDAERGLYWVKRAIEVNPSSAAAWEKKGELLLAWQKPRESLEAFNRALALDGQLNLARLNLAVAYQALGELEKAREVARQAVRLAPKDPETHRRYAAVLEKAGKFAEAENEYHKALALDPDHLGSLLGLARLLIRRKEKLAEARKLAQHANELRPGNGEAATMAAWALFLSGEKDTALRELEQVVRAHPTNFEAWVLFSNGLEQTGRHKLAKKAAAMAVQVGPRRALRKRAEALAAGSDAAAGSSGDQARPDNSSQQVP